MHHHLWYVTSFPKLVTCICCHFVCFLLSKPFGYRWDQNKLHPSPVSITSTIDAPTFTALM